MCLFELQPFRILLVDGDDGNDDDGDDDDDAWSGRAREAAFLLHLCRVLRGVVNMSRHTPRD